MTTVSNHKSLNPLARTKGGCATTNSTARTKTTDASPKEDDYDGMMPLMGIREDEEIASVEADGGANHTRTTSGSGSVEKKILTAALVTSMADAGARSEHQHVTPTTSEASSFSSMESTDSSMNQSSGSAAVVAAAIVAPSKGTVTSNSTAAANSRTIYPRASKAAATTKVTTALTCKKPSPKAKRKLDVKQEASASSKSKHPPSSRPVPNPLAMMDGTKMPPPQPQVTFQYMQYPQAVGKAPNPVAVTSAKVAASNIHDPIPIKQPDNSFSAVAESMSTQQYQTDNLMSSSTNDLMSSQSSQNPQGRGRIFSIDLDPAVLDFVESVVDPLQHSEETAGRSRNYSVTFDDDVNSNSGRMSLRRERGFSFEFFSLGIDSEEPLPPPTEDDGERWNRVRGDSIIFDPVSFREGGIHETSALMHVEHESQDRVVGDSCTATGVAAVVPHVKQVQVPPSMIHNPPMRPPAVTGMQSAKGPSASSSKPPAKASSRQAKASGTSKQRSKAKSQNVCVPKLQGNSSYRQITITSSSRNCPQSFDDNTIHMPHGSDAAAAAAAGISQPSSSTSSDGFSGISHTSCPMELLNKGGRIGIYLPEERKARIAKFHDKRKQRMWRKKIKYDCRKKLADSRPRIKGRFVKRSDVDEV